MTFERPEKNNLRTHEQTSTTRTRIVRTGTRGGQTSKPIVPESELGALKIEIENRMEGQIVNDLKRRELTQTQKSAFLKASNVDDPRVEKGVITSTTRTPSVVSPTRALVILT